MIHINVAQNIPTVVSSIVKKTTLSLSPNAANVSTDITNDIGTPEVVMGTPEVVETSVVAIHTPRAEMNESDNVHDAVMTLLTLGNVPANAVHKTLKKMTKHKRTIVSPKEVIDEPIEVVHLVDDAIFSWYNSAAVPIQGELGSDGGATADKINQAAVQRAIAAGAVFGHINENSRKRLLDVSVTLAACENMGIVSFTRNPLPRKECLFGFHQMIVSDLKTVNDEIRKMVERDLGRIWKKAGGSYSQTLKYPSWGGSMNFSGN